MPERYTARPRIEIDGTPLSDELDALVERAVVANDLFFPDMFEVRLRDADRDVLTKAGMAIGSKVRILAGPVGESASDPLVTAEVTSLEAEYDSTGSHAVVRGYDPSHRFHRGRRTETYRNVTDSDIARTVAQRAGVEIGRIDDTLITYEHVSQANLTDWEFLRARAREADREIAVVDGKFEFREPIDSSGAPGEGDLSSTDPMQLVLDADIDVFRPRVTSAEQVGEVQVRGWDPRQKQAIVATAPAKTTSAELELTPADLAAMFGNPTYVVVDRPLSTQAEADAVAKAVSEQIAGAFAEADGSVRGNPKVKAGIPVSVSQTEPQFAGKYTITSTRHVFDENGYKTHFVVSGRQERSLLGLASLGATNGAMSAGGPPIYGVVVAQVTDVADPDQLGRVKVKFPWLSDTYESDWVRMPQAGAGKQRGMVIMPEVNDEVLVAFEHGDVRRPYVIGCLYNGIDTPKLGDGLFDTSTGAVKRRGFVSKKGGALVFFDDDAKEGIALLTGDKGLRISLNKTNTTIRITSNGKVEIEGSQDVTVESGTKLTIKAGTSIEMSAPQVSVKGDSQVEVKSGATMNVEGATVNVKGSASADIDGGAMCNVHAAMVKIN